MSVVEDRFRKRTIEHVTLPEGASRAAARSQVDTDALERIRDDVLPALAAGVAVAVPQNPDYLLRPITASEGALAAHMQPGSTAYGRVGSWRAAPLVTGMLQDLPRIIRTERPRLVLLDLMLPEVDGIELMAQVPDLADLPVIFISAYGREETVAKALDSGAADYIVKPFSPTELVARVRAALRRREEPKPVVNS